MKKNTTFKYYAMNYDVNRRGIKYINVLNREEIKEIERDVKKGKITTRGAFKESLRLNLKHRYWARRECEMSIGDLYEKDLNKYEKIDVYDQIEPNLDLITDYVINKMGIKFEE